VTLSDRTYSFVGSRDVALAQREMSPQSHAGRPPTVHRGSGSSPRSRQVSTVARLTARRSAISAIPTGSMRESVAKVLTSGKGCDDNHYMTSRQFADTTSSTIEQVWGGPCDHHNCKGDCVAFISINFTDGGSVGGYLCRTHLNEYEAAYQLPLTGGAA
jgi:hypothetical protein